MKHVGNAVKMPELFEVLLTTPSFRVTQRYSSKYDNRCVARKLQCIISLHFTGQDAELVDIFQIALLPPINIISNRNMTVFMTQEWLP
jgi:hypothetical protein